MKTIGGIPVISMSEVVAPVFEHFQRPLGDTRIKDDILGAMKEAAGNDELGAKRRFLAADPVWWLGTLRDAYFYQSSLERYAEWAEAKCALLLTIARTTREDDGIIQHILNYEDFHVEVMGMGVLVMPHLPFAPDFVAEMYDLRGLDFFLFHYMGGETNAHSDAALFDHAACVPRALELLGRSEEAQAAEDELQARRDRLTTIGRDFQPPGSDSNTPAFERLRLSGERFWFGYLSQQVWLALADRSRQELLDAFATEILLQREVLTTWSTVALMLCKVVEREAATTLFRRWQTTFDASDFNPPEPLSRREKRRIDSRRMTFDTVQKASSRGHSPTLGQLVFLASYWNDELMDRCTPVFQQIRTECERFNLTHTEQVQRLATLLGEPLIAELPQPPTVVRLRNASAHPQTDRSLPWPRAVAALKQVLGEPPREILRLITVELRVP